MTTPLTSLINGVQVKPITQNVDHRGWLGELFRMDSLPANLLPVMSYVSCTHSGIVRGPHEHLTQTDIFVFLTGIWKIKLWDNRSLSPTASLIMCFQVDSPTLVIVPPMVVHAYSNIGPTDGLTLNLPNVLYKGFNKQSPPDEIRHEENPAFSTHDITVSSSWIKAVKAIFHTGV